MKRLIPILLTLFLLCGCASAPAPAQVAATTLPVYEFTLRLCEGTPITVTRLVTEEVSCLHDYSLNVRQVKAAEAADLIIISGGGLESFMEDLFCNASIVDASASGIHFHEASHAHDHGHEEQAAYPASHDHEQDPHIWLAPENAKVMAANICEGLKARYPEYADTFGGNLSLLLSDLDTLQAYGEDQLSSLGCRELITFHDGFSYFAEAFGLTILEAVEEESGSEASAKDLIHLIEEVEHHNLRALFTEKNGSDSAASIISRETGCALFSLDMAMAGDSYFDAMYHNINTIREAME